MSSRLITVAVVAALGLPGCSVSESSTASDLGKIRHVVVIMQENRSFDSFPDAALTARLVYWRP